MEPQLNGQPSSTQAPAQADRSIQPLTLMLVLAMAAVLFFVGLGATGLTDRDEGRNAEAGREMYETGNYISPTFNYEPRFAKPVFARRGMRVFRDDANLSANPALWGSIRESLDAARYLLVLATPEAAA